VSAAVASLTEEAAIFTARLRYEDLPAAVVVQAERCVLDGVAVALAGSEHETLSVLARHLERLGGPPHARLLGDASTRVPVQHAALWHGVAGHVLDWDDTQVAEAPGRVYGQLMHPTIPPLAAALAISDLLGVVDGASFLTAFAAGFEVECKIAEAISPAHYTEGFHTSGTVGTFGAAACAAKLIGLDADATAMAIGIAASMAAGIRANFGTMTKALHVGRAAQNGVTAALLAQDGFTADTRALDGRWGYLSVAGGGGDPELVLGRFGRPHSMVDPGVSVKPFACGVLTHPSMDALASLLREEALTAADLAVVRLHAAENALAPIRYERATNELEARFCFPFLLSAIALTGGAGKGEFTPEFITRREVHEFQSRVEVVHDPEIEAMGFDRIRSKVVIETRDGRLFERWADERYRGGPERPLSDAELRAKLDDAAAGLLAHATVDEVATFVARLDTQTEVAPLLDLLDWRSR
jgi:2-methylcitrate dehydratase PrpD